MSAEPMVGAGVADIVGGVILCAMAAYAFSTVSSGAGIPTKPYPGGEIPEVKLIGVLYCLGQGTIHVIRGAQYATGSTGGLYLPDLEYADFIFFCPMIVLDIMFTLKIPGKLLATGITVLALFTATNAYASSGPYQWMLFGVGIVLLGLLFERMQSGVRQRLAELPSTAVGPLYIAMVAFFGMWPLFPIIYLLGPNSADVLDRVTFVSIHVVLDIVCKGVLALALLRVRGHMENAGWYGYSLAVGEIRDRLVARLSEATKSSAKSSAAGSVADITSMVSSGAGQDIRSRG